MKVNSSPLIIGFFVISLFFYVILSINLIDFLNLADIKIKATIWLIGLVVYLEVNYFVAKYFFWR